MEMVTEIYQLTQKFPKEELFGLTGQLRRAAVSIPSNIAEGQARLFPKEFHQFLGHTRGSLAELETQILIARNLRYLEDGEVNRLLEMAAEVGRILNRLLASVKRQ
jgi:four helix bundle protein